MKLVLFDLDNTLLSGDTDVDWLEFLVELGSANKKARSSFEAGLFRLKMAWR